MPQHAAGIRTEPDVSVPNATSASPVATATAEPLDEPPGTRDGSSGFTGVPAHGFTPSAATHSSLRLVFPTMLAPWARADATTGASAAAGPPRYAAARHPRAARSAGESMRSRMT